MKFQRSLPALLLVLVVWLAVGCFQTTEPNQVPVGPSVRSSAPMDIPEPCGEVTTATLFAGQTIDVGTVTIANDGETLCVTYHTTGDWYLTENHLDIALAPEEIPQTGSGNPRPGQFSYRHDLTAPAQSDAHCFSLSELGYEPETVLYIAAHCAVVRMVDGEVVQSETAWGDGLPFPGANWATYMEHTVQSCDGGGGE